MANTVGLIDPRKHVSAEVKNAIKNLLFELSIARRHKRGVRLAAEAAATSDLKINVGSGRKTKQGWINIDLFTGGGGKLHSTSGAIFRSGHHQPRSFTASMCLSTWAIRPRRPTS